MPLDDAPHVGQADGRPFELVFGMQPLKHAEQFVGVLHVEARPVVANKNPGLRLCLLAADMDPRPGFGPRVLDGVAEEIDHHLVQQERIAADRRQRVHEPLDLAPLGLAGQVLAGRAHHIAQRDVGPAHLGAAHARESQ